jgi:ATP-dependent 26S proteasome regulatory subunit
MGLQVRKSHSQIVYCSVPLNYPAGIWITGTGKTALARAAATEAGAKLFVVNGPDVVSEYFGESEAGLEGVFAAARALEPSVCELT